MSVWPGKVVAFVSSLVFSWAACVETIERLVPHNELHELVLDIYWGYIGVILGLYWD